ncbi:hypothetical protein RCL_jg14765.t1 [Rhizophagus clarus]|uniref:Uncharacterized protein n=1 Tax=Rhizophagus clarus TaxID=94130 RepID=A0A8H3QYF4_9GLOM|nr:hypothetical protein RCL_jg14765.t1 [Rhizophagus clarus]
MYNQDSRLASSKLSLDQSTAVPPARSLAAGLDPSLREKYCTRNCLKLYLSERHLNLSRDLYIARFFII